MENTWVEEKISSGDGSGKDLRRTPVETLRRYHLVHDHREVDYFCG